LVRRRTQRLGFSVLAESNGLVDPSPPLAVTTVTQNSPKKGKGGKHLAPGAGLGAGASGTG